MEEKVMLEGIEMTCAQMNDIICLRTFRLAREFLVAQEVIEKRDLTMQEIFEMEFVSPIRRVVLKRKG